MKDRQILILAKAEVQLGLKIGKPISLEEAIYKVKLKIARLEQIYEPNFL